MGSGQVEAEAKVKTGGCLHERMRDLKSTGLECGYDGRMLGGRDGERRSRTFM